MHTGLTNILEWVGRTSGVDEDMSCCFSDGDAAKALSIARYWIGTGGNTLPRLESWQVRTINLLETTNITNYTNNEILFKKEG